VKLSSEAIFCWEKRWESRFIQLYFVAAVLAHLGAKKLFLGNHQHCLPKTGALLLLICMVLDARRNKKRSPVFFLVSRIPANGMKLLTSVLLPLLAGAFFEQQTWTRQATLRRAVVMVGSKRTVDRRSKDNKVQDDGGGGDSWKVLTVKLDSVKAAKARFGKVDVVKIADDGVDELQCRHFATCAGCSVKSGFDDTPVVRKAKRFFESEGSNMAVHLANVTGWRSHVKLAVQPLSKWGGLKIGLYKGGTHAVEPIPYCRVHHPRINEAVEVLHRAAVDLGVSGYAEASKGQPATGELRYVQMSVDRSSGRIQLTLVWNALTFKEAGQNLPRLVKRLKGNPDLWHSVSANFQTSESNAIFNFHPKAWKTLWGPPLLREQVGDAAFYFQPQIFRQVSHPPQPVTVPCSYLRLCCHCPPPLTTLLPDV
jgi:hypothetical protein